MVANSMGLAAEAEPFEAESKVVVDSGIETNLPLNLEARLCVSKPKESVSHARRL